STAGFEDPTKVTLFLATETLIVSKLKKAFSEKMKLETGQTKLDELETLPLALNLLEGTTGIMQKSRETTGRMLIFNPISLTGAGAVEAVLLLGVVERMNWQLNRSLRETYQNQIEKFAELARSRPLSPELHARLIALRNRLTMLFPGAKFSGIPTPTAPSPTPSPLPQ
ncbi:MAG: hypothetical protein EBX52_10160, partial [Proteobacteria bacterium]|nr:hypothetical protein [Pseudomonadota bacterium]